MLVRNGNASEAPLCQNDEARVYKSKETELVLGTLHLLQFNCDFDLFYIRLNKNMVSTFFFMSFNKGLSVCIYLRHINGGLNNGWNLIMENITCGDGNHL